MEETPLKSRSDPRLNLSSDSRKPMSSALKERLKRARRSFTSPSSVVKRLRINEDEPEQTVSNEASQGNEAQTDINSNESIKLDSSNRFEPNSVQTAAQCDLQTLHQKLKTELKEKAETLRRLKMVKMYRTKNDLTELQVLIDKWRLCAQSVLYELQTELPRDGKKASLSQLIDHFGLNDEILHFDRTEDDFMDS